MNNSKGKYFKCNKEKIKKCNTLYLKLSKLNGLKVNILLGKKSPMNAKEQYFASVFF